jgi:ribose 5-phosphate isomerase
MTKQKNGINPTKLNIENHYVMTEIENKIMDFDYPILENEKLEKELVSIYNAIQNIKDLLENNQVTYGE